MALKREVFTIVEDNSTQEGVKLPARSESDAVGGNHIPAITAKDSSGNYQLTSVRTAGQAAAGVNSTPTLPAKDLAGNLQALNLRDEGDSSTGVDALPGLVAKDPSGNLKYLRLNVDNELIISNTPDGTRLSKGDTATITANNTITTIATVTLAASKTYEDIEARGSSTNPTLWTVIKNDNATLTTLDQFITGSGQFSFNMHYVNLEFSSGATGTQQLIIKATQLQGSVNNEVFGYVSAFQKA